VRAALHRFLLMLLLLILPLQALAAVSMSGCPLNSVAVPPAAETMHMAGCHENTSPPGDAPVAHDCTHCAACVLAAACPLPRHPDLTLAPALQRYMPHTAAVFSGFIPSGPERPPRLSLA
jgi:hypothetical protein